MYCSLKKQVEHRETQVASFMVQKLYLFDKKKNSPFSFLRQVRDECFRLREFLV